MKKAAQSGLLAEGEGLVEAAPAGADAAGDGGRVGALTVTAADAGRTAVDAALAGVAATVADAEVSAEEAALAAGSGVSAGKVCRGGGGSATTGSGSGRIQAATAKAATNKAAMADRGVLFFCSAATSASTDVA